MKTTVFIARHGETTWNIDKRIQGENDYPLTVKGYRHRRGLYLLLKDKKIDRIYTSALKRTVDTASALAHEIDIRPTADATLNEISFGLLEGESMVSLDPWAEKKWHWWLQDPIRHRIPGGGENYLDLKARVDRFFDSNQQSWIDKTILIVGHRCINRLIIGHLAGLSLEESLLIDQENDLVYRIDLYSHRSSQVYRIRTMPNEVTDKKWQPGIQIKANVIAAH